jgi:DNA-binding response OmpR family regulator
VLAGAPYHGRVRILLIEDNPSLHANLTEQLEQAGHEVDLAVDGQSGLRLALAGDHDVVVLDLGLPRLDGIEVCRRLRAQRGAGPLVLMLTARDTLDDKLEGFAVGADDYLVKPFEGAELLVRLNALSRRTTRVERDVLAVDDLRYDLGQVRVERAGRPLALNRVGLRILRELMRASPNVVTREQLEGVLWDGFSPEGSVLRSHIYALRKAIDQDGGPPLLHTVRGIGYRLAREEQQ